MQTMNILLVDDLPENLMALESLLRQPGVNIFRAQSGDKALELLLEHEFAVALVDVQMPLMDGFELAELMRGTERTRNVPIIFVTAGAHSRVSTFRGYDSGAVDLLHKPLDPHVVRSKVQVFLELSRQNHLVRQQLAQTQNALSERDEALAEAREALQTRDEFLSIASHELKTPLTSLHLQLQMLIRYLGKLEAGGRAPDATAQFLERSSHALTVASRQSTKLSTLLDELLDLTRIRLGKLTLSREELSVAQLARDVFERFQGEASAKNVKMELRVDTDVTAHWDSMRMEQVISNLVSNALKYGEGQPVQMHVGSTGSGDVQIVVKDQGMGIQPELQEKIFQRFERAIHAEQISGLGLGLYITRQILEAHGGTIAVRSKPGEGSEFTVNVPLGQADNPEA